MMSINKITNNIYQIKIIDLNTRDFHGCVYPVKEGTSYNSYLIVDEKVVLIDTIDDIYYNHLQNALDRILGERSIDYVIINHVEPDHSGSYASIIKRYPNAITYTSKMGEKAMQNHFFGSYEYHQVSYPDTLSTGNYTLAFLETPMVHWPDNMWTYCIEEKILFSNDAFGQLIVDDVAFASEVGLDKYLDYSKEYYANIVWPCNNSVLKLLERLNEIKWEFKVIAPSHGLMNKEYINEIVGQYYEFTQNKLNKKALVLYESMWNNSKQMAMVISNELKLKGYEVKTYQISKTRVSEIMKEMVDTKLVAIGSGNYNNHILPPVADLLERFSASKFLGRKAIVFGSYGWAKVPLHNLIERLEEANFEVISKPLYIQYVLNEEKEKDLRKEISSLDL